MSSRDEQRPPAESRERTLAQVRRLTIATGSAALGATALFAGLAAAAPRHAQTAATATSSVATSQSTTQASSNDDTTDSGSNGVIAPQSSSAAPVAVSGGS
ncbi:MAG TPA: hypothetical protein VGK92_12835 [Gaiellales bacterium]|jgi:hypothetical protein